MLRSVVETPAAAAVVLELVWPCLAAVHLVQSVRYHQSTSRRTVFANARRTKQRRLHQLHDSPSKRSLSQLVGYFSDGEVSVVIILYEFLEYFYWLVFFSQNLCGYFVEVMAPYFYICNVCSIFFNGRGLVMGTILFMNVWLDKFQYINFSFTQHSYISRSRIN